MVKAETKVPSRLPAPPKTTTRKVSTIYREPLSRAGGTNCGEGGACHTRDAAADGEGAAVDQAGIDSDRPTHGAILDRGTNAQTNSRAVNQQQKAAEQEKGERHHKDAILRNINRLRRLKRPKKPFRKRGGDFARSEDASKRLLHDEAQAPGGEQGIEWSSIEKANHAPLDERSGGRRHDEGDHDGENKIVRRERGEFVVRDLGAEVHHVGSERHKLTVGEIDDTHLAKDDGQTEGHKQENTEEAQP